MNRYHETSDSPVRSTSTTENNSGKLERTLLGFTSFLNQLSWAIIFHNTLHKNLSYTPMGEKHEFN